MCMLSTETTVGGTKTGEHGPILRAFVLAWHRRIECADNKSWMHHYQPKSKQTSMHWKHSQSPMANIYKTTPSAVKVILIDFWDAEGILQAYFQLRDTNVNPILCCEVLGKFCDAIHQKCLGLLSSGILLHYNNVRLHMPEWW